MSSFGTSRVFRVLLLVLGLAVRADAQGPAGRDHRLRHRPLRWRVFHAPAFHLYYPEGADSLAAFAAREWPEAVARLQASGSGLPLPGDPQLLLYPATTALYASNSGRGLPGAKALPTVIRTGNRLLVPYDGSYEALRGQLRGAAVRAAWDGGFPAGSLQRQAAGDARGRLPDWYREGTVAWLAGGWGPGEEDAWSAWLDAHPLASWNEAAEALPALAGGAFNQYLAETSFPRAPQGVLAQVRAKGSLARGQRLVTKQPLDTVLARCLEWYRQRADGRARATGGTDSLASRNGAFRRPAGILRSWQAAPGGAAVAVVLERPERRELWRFDAATGGRHRLLRYRLPPWLAPAPADGYPLAAWEGEALWTAVPFKKGFRLARWERGGRKPSESLLLPGIDGLSAFASLGGGRFLLAAHRQGQSDLVVWDSRKLRYTPWTADSPDDGAFALPPGDAGPELVFRSARRRPADSGCRLWRGLYWLQGTSVAFLVGDTAEWIGWGAPQALGGGRFLAPTTRTGTARWAVVSDDGRTEWLRTGAPVQALPARGRVAQLEEAGDSLVLRTEAVQDWLDRHRAGPADTGSPWLAAYRRASSRRQVEDSVLRAARDTTPSFLSGVLGVPGRSSTAARQRDSLREAATFRPSKSRPYVLQLHTAYFTARINNDYFINRYQPYRAYLGSFKYPETGALAQVGFADLFEDHRITVAYRLPTATQGSDFFLRYTNDRRRTGWGLAYFRKVETLRPDASRGWKADDGRPYPAAAKVKTHYAELTLERPLAYDWAVRATVAVRKDRTVFLATDRYGLDFGPLTSLWGIATLSGGLDRRIPAGNGLYRGGSAQVAVDGFGGGPDRAALGAVQLRVEGHGLLHPAIGLVVRGQAAASGGGARVRYTLGGVDGAVNPRVDDSTARAPQAAPYAFQTLATPLRGYAQNSLWGDRYALGNADVLVALLPLLRRTTVFEALNRLQLGLWADGAVTRESGSAGAGGQRGWAFGWSARTVLAGYPLRLDWGWPGTFGEPPVWYLSLAAF